MVFDFRSIFHGLSVFTFSFKCLPVKRRIVQIELFYLDCLNSSSFLLLLVLFNLRVLLVHLFQLGPVKIRIIEVDDIHVGLLLLFYQLHFFFL